ncbi:hypothetical protein F9L00_14380 [Brucella anthropi]|uniref:Uncharacterized protein n=1 Tax=Brucella haematophila TaxID=419474 RepID=A0ABX1DL86_9HYPH|nr:MULTISPECIES: hypothetical protein [Brucella]KAB2776518.1 hypothetical protein F9L00_14380 [Brucella anthropi]NKC02433.1 hypothetical protein [Brucella haematophila]TMV03103.1 hypothetical protein FGI60_11850 [Brucella haematophila]WKT94530.1 hypothetical protein QYR01_10525 [Brucella anthropi]
MQAKMKKQIKSFIAELEKRTETFSAAVDEMRDEYENKSERWQDSEKGEAALEDIDNCENVYSEVENLLESLRALVDE